MVAGSQLTQQKDPTEVAAQPQGVLRDLISCQIQVLNTEAPYFKSVYCRNQKEHFTFGNLVILTSLFFSSDCFLFLHVIGKQGEADTNCKELENVPQQISQQF